jgi:antitoxin HigA-1
MRKPKDIFLAPPDGFSIEPVHPGELLKEELAARGLTAHAVALKLAEKESGARIRAEVESAA